MRWNDFERIFRAIPTLETERLVLRAMSRADTADMYEYACQPAVSKYLLWEPHETPKYTRSHLAGIERAYRAGTFYDWGIHDRITGKMIGTVGFTRLDEYSRVGEVGYVLTPAYWGRGIATEAVSHILAFGFETLDLHRIEARYMVENAASRRVMEKCGMTFEGVHRDLMLVKGKYRDIGTCAILYEEYKRRIGER